MSDLAVTLTVEQLRALVREAVREALQPPNELGIVSAGGNAPPTERELAEARRRLRKIGRGI